jgi:hypothetical protein
VFATSRLIEFCSVKELTTQTGHGPDQWPLVITKEIVDNAIDEAEKCGVSPVIDVEVIDGNIIISDNGQGIAAETVEKLAYGAFDIEPRTMAGVLVQARVLNAETELELHNRCPSAQLLGITLAQSVTRLSTGGGAGTLS